MLIKQLLEFFDLDKIKALKVTTVIAIVTFLHSYLYMPYHTKQLFKDVVFKRMVKDAVADNFNIFKAEELSLELKLSQELDVPFHLVPHKISAVIKLADKAQKIYPEMATSARIVPVGIILNGGRIMYVDHKGFFRHPEEDSVGYFRYLKTGDKHYLYLK